MYKHVSQTYVFDYMPCVENTSPNMYFQVTLLTLFQVILVIIHADL